VTEHWDFTDRDARRLRRERVLDLWARGYSQDEIGEQIGENGSVVGWIVVKAQAAGDRRATRHDTVGHGPCRPPPWHSRVRGPTRNAEMRVRIGQQFPVAIRDLSAIVSASRVEIRRCPPGIPFTGIPHWA
jgi:hypothetical protein